MSQPKNDLTVDEYMEAFETRLKEVRNRETASSVPLPPVRNTRSSSSRARPAVSVKKNEEKKKNEEEEEKVNLPPYVRELLETKCPEWLAEWEPRVARNERKWMEERAAAVREGREFEFLRASDSEGEDDEVMGENPGVEEESDDELSEVDSAIFAEEEEEEKFDAAEYVEALVEEVCVEDDDTAAGAVATGNRMVILDYEWDGQWPFAEEVREKAKESGVKLSDAALYKYAENLLSKSPFSLSLLPTPSTSFKAISLFFFFLLPPKVSHVPEC